MRLFLRKITIIIRLIHQKSITRIFGFSENELLLKEVLRESSLEFMRFLAIGLHFNNLKIDNLCWQKIESDYRGLSERLCHFPSDE